MRPNPLVRLALLALLVAAPIVGGEPALTIWSLTRGEVVPEHGALRASPVGSIQKLWVAKAWGQAHSDSLAKTPRFACVPGSGCWDKAGHGEIGLRRATAISCNSFFLALAREVPRDLLGEVFHEAGFEVRGPLVPERAIGLASAGGAVAITPAALLRAFHLLLTTPWLVRDDVRHELIDGLRDAGENGTALAVPVQGLLVKTGTVESLDGKPLSTSGWAVVADPSFETIRLALLRDGTGSAAAARLGECWRNEGTGLLEKRSHAPVERVTRELTRPFSRQRSQRRALPEQVRVRLFSALTPSRLLARNVGRSPLRVEIAGGRTSWTGPDVSVQIVPGMRLQKGLWELTLEPYRLVRVVRGSLELARGQRSLTLTTLVRDWVEGVVRGETPNVSRRKRDMFVPVILRFLRSGHRHDGVDVCDLSHCARFIGFGPEVSWPTPRMALVTLPSPSPSGRDVFQALLDEEEWTAAIESSENPGPALWSTDCGGEPLSARAVWGAGSDQVFPCPRPSAGTPALTWSRVLLDDTLREAFRQHVVAIQSIEPDGVRRTRVSLTSGSVELLYDDLHRRLARVAGWDSLPSPPDSWNRVPGGWRVQGRGKGHRVGYCLAGSDCQ